MSVPKLRFKEFDKNWEQIKISDYSDTVTSGSRDWAQYYSDKGDKFIRMTNLVRDGIYLDLSDLRFVDLPNDSNEGKRTSLQSGDILISITAELGKLGWVHDDLGTAYINQHTALVRMSEKVDSKFIAYTLSTEKYNNRLNNLNDSGAKAGLNLGTIRSFELSIPSKPEQTKIAFFLSAADEKINQLTQKHELLSQYKQGMMQKLFSQQIRFKADNGSVFGEWEDKPLNEIAEITMGSSPKSENYNEDLNGLPLLQGNADIKNRKSLPRTYTSEITKKCNVGDILLSVRAPVGFVATSNHYACIGRGLCSIKAKPNYLQSFIYQWLLSKENSWGSLSQGSTFESVNSDQIKSLSIQIPCLEEQTKIANFLSAIDQKIDVVAQKIEQAKQWKKGLLQQMFV
jgi:type I restriction enzyme S subunit